MKIKNNKEPPLFQVIKDIKNYRSWIKVIKEERSNPNSKYNKFELSHNYFFILYFTVTLPDEDAALPEKIKRLRLYETLTPVHQYLDMDLGFADYIIPEFNQFYDQEGNPTLSYGIIYRFAFKRLSLKWFLTRSLFIGFLTWALIKWPILSNLFN